MIGFDLFPRKEIVFFFAIKRETFSLFSEFWEWGHDLYRTSPSTFPALFISGDIFDPNVLSQDVLGSPALRPDNLSSLTSLNSLKGHVSAIHASLFFHLFDEETQLDAARRTATLLCPEKGSVIFGRHYVRSTQGTRTEVLADGTVHTQFWHSPESWRQLWEKQVFEHSRGSIRVEMELEISTEYTVMESEKDAVLYMMNWCITKL